MIIFRCLYIEWARLLTGHLIFEDKEMIDKDFGGFDPATKKLVPMDLVRVFGITTSPYVGNPAAVLENIAGALEAGVLTDDGWVAELFASPRCYRAFETQAVMAGAMVLEVERFSKALHKLAGCKTKQRSASMLMSKLTERARKAGQVVDFVIKPRGL